MRNQIDADEQDEAPTELKLTKSAWNSWVTSSNVYTRLKKLELNGNGLTNLPSDLERAVPNIEILFLSENKFREIPKVSKLKSLRMISLRGNQLKALSSEHLPASLVWLILTNNRIELINRDVSELVNVRKLMLSHNRLKSIPEEIGGLTGLELIRLSNNELNESLPRELLTLPKLSWISISGNPIAIRPVTNKKEIPKEMVSYNKSQILGLGASGTVYKGRFESKDVAVKIFKHDSKGSDGLAVDEVKIQQLVDHPLAVVANGVFLSDDGTSHEGMVMDLLNNTEAIGLTPSFDTVTRDAGPSDAFQDLSRDDVCKVIWNVGSVLDQLHSFAKVSHSDVYLHNILCDKGIAMVSDFGASFCYGDASHFEAIEVLAFGRLVEDLFAWFLGISVPNSISNVGCISGSPLEEGQLKVLLGSILQPDQGKRPTFSEIMETLSRIPDFDCARKAVEHIIQ
mmetsp:Transcript_4377/g.10050  ORF Transcript_4377/g.10050 Transcript_4377/m.10050 type:complete len:456 (-) Transcript_4377:2153-3520(-)